MSVLVGFATVLLLALACLGGGRAVLVALGLTDRLEPQLVNPVGFAIGVGLLGWLTFFLAVSGLLAPVHLIALVLPGLLGLALRVPLITPAEALGGRPLDAVVVACAVMLTVIAALDMVQAMAPPADADSLAYHFALPKQFLAAGHLQFVPRAIDGAIPLLLHVTYLVALGIGGERALTLWVMLLGWVAAWLFYGLGRGVLDRRWALMLVGLFVTTSGAGSCMEPSLAS